MICAVFGVALAAVRQPVPHPVSHSEGHSDHGPVGRSEDAHAEVLERKDDVRPDGFAVSWDTSNKITEQRDGDEHGNIKGEYSWISPEGEHIVISYVADEHGYQPHGDSIPKVPEYVARAIEWNAAHSHEDSHNVHH